MVALINNQASQSSVSQVLQQQQQAQQNQQAQNDREQVRQAQLAAERQIERTRVEKNSEVQADLAPNNQDQKNPSESRLGRSVDVRV